MVPRVSRDPRGTLGVVADVKPDTLREAIAEHVDLPNTHLQTDSLRTYQPIAEGFASHGSSTTEPASTCEAT